MCLASAQQGGANSSVWRRLEICCFCVNGRCRKRFGLHVFSFQWKCSCWTYPPSDLPCYLPEMLLGVTERGLLLLFPTSPICWGGRTMLCPTPPLMRPWEETVSRSWPHLRWTSSSVSHRGQDSRGHVCPWLFLVWSAVASVPRSWELPRPWSCPVHAPPSERRPTRGAQRPRAQHGLHVASAVLEEKRWKKKGKQIPCRCLTHEAWTKLKTLNFMSINMILNKYISLKCQGLGVCQLCWVLGKIWKILTEGRLCKKKRVWVCVHIYVHMCTDTCPLQLPLRCSALCKCRRKRDLQGIFILSDEVSERVCAKWRFVYIHKLFQFK